MYFSTNVLCNSFKDRVLTGEACAVVPISECKSRDFFNTSQIFREENSEETLGLPKNIDTSALIINNKWRRKNFHKKFTKTDLPMDSFSKYLILYPCGKILSYHFMIKMLKNMFLVDYGASKTHFKHYTPVFYCFTRPIVI